MPWNYPHIAKGSKLGIHSIAPNQVENFVQQAVDRGCPFSVVKAVDDLSWLVGVKARSPSTITVGRLSGDHEKCQDLMNVEPSFYAERAMQVIENKINGQPELIQAVDYWEPFNETPAGDGSRLGFERLAEAMRLCMAIARDWDERTWGIRLGLFAFTTGTPNLAQWGNPEFEWIAETGVFAQAQAEGHILTLHEGCMAFNDPDHPWPAYEVLNARYHHYYEILAARGEVIPLIVSEWAGWGKGGVPDTALAARVAQYDYWTRDDGYVLGFCPFTLGPVAQWGPTDWEYAYPLLLDHMENVKDIVNAAPPEVNGPPPPPDDGNGGNGDNGEEEPEMPEVPIMDSFTNGGFEDWSEGNREMRIFPTVGDPYMMERPEVFNPTGWRSWCKHGLPVDHDPGNTVGWSMPEVGPIGIDVDMNRVLVGGAACKLFTFSRIHDAGLMQRVGVIPGHRYRLTGYAHAWSNHYGEHEDDPEWSEGAGQDCFAELEEVPGTTDELRNFTFQMSVSLTGDDSPYNTDLMAEGAKIHIYNCYAAVPDVEFLAIGDVVTVFLRSTTLWPFKHNDAYWDDIQLVDITEEPEPPPEPPVDGITEKALDWLDGLASTILVLMDLIEEG